MKVKKCRNMQIVNKHYFYLQIWAIFIGYVFITFSTESARAAISISGVSGASASSIAAGTSPIIYGGVSGTCASYSTTETCDSCANTATLATCNRTRINSSLNLTINFKSTTASGRAILARNDGTVVALGGTAVNANNSSSITTVWSNLCPAMTPDNPSNCESTANALISHSFKLGVDVNGNGTLDNNEDQTAMLIQVLNPSLSGTVTDFDQINDCTTNETDNRPGICGFMAYPGDQKVFLENIESGSGFPSTTTGTVKFINVYASKTRFINSPSEMIPSALTVEQTASGIQLTNKIVTGLENQEPYYFRLSVSDPARNEMYFTSNSSITANCSGVVPPAVPAFPFDGTGAGDLCPFAAIPDEVVGLLNNNMNCFIATAAFGSILHPVVKDLREFRNQFLLPFTWGRKFVSWYYSWSPKSAEWLRQNNWSIPVVKMLLLPIWLLTRALKWWPITFIFVFSFLYIRRRRRPNSPSRSPQKNKDLKTISLAVLITLSTCSLNPSEAAQSTKKTSINSSLPKKKKVNPPPEVDNEAYDTFFDQEDPLPPEDPVESQGEFKTTNDPNKEILPEIVESNQLPDDEGIEYADEAEKLEQERLQKIEEQKKALTPERPPIDDPMPLIKRQRQAEQMATKPKSKFIRHPNAAKGLRKITKEKIYVYNVEPSSQDSSSTLHFGFLSPTRLENTETGRVYEDFYPSQSFAILYDYEWQFFKKIARWGIKAGTGLGIAQGSGQFRNGSDLNGEIEPKEKLSFLIIPNTVGAIVRLQFWDNQFIVPYAEGGGVGFLFSELRDDNKSPKFGGALGAYFAVGGAVSLRSFDIKSIMELDREYGINNVYFSGEYRYYIGGGNYDFTTGMINGGLTFDF